MTKNGTFITGTTGNIGSRLLKEYLTVTEDHLYLLVRGNSQVEAQSRVKKVMEFWDVPLDRYRNRITVLKGDMYQPNLGLSSSAVKELEEKAQQLVHTASNIRLDLPISKARQMIVEPTQSIIEMAKKFKKLNRIGYVSTLEVTGDYQELVKEEFLTDVDRGFLNSYGQAKSEAEECLKKAITQDNLPVTIFRPSMVVGESTSGKALGFQSFYLLLEKLILNPDFKIVPRATFIDTIPVDILAQSIQKLMAFDPAKSQIYHLCQGQSDYVSFGDLLNLTQALIQPISLPKYIHPWAAEQATRLAKNLTWGRIKHLAKIQQVFLPYLNFLWKWDNNQWKESMTSLGLEPPRFGSYYPHLLSYYLPNKAQTRLPF